MSLDVLFAPGRRQDGILGAEGTTESSFFTHHLSFCVLSFLNSHALVFLTEGIVSYSTMKGPRGNMNRKSRVWSRWWCLLPVLFIATYTIQFVIKDDRSWQIPIGDPKNEYATHSSSVVNKKESAGDFFRNFDWAASSFDAVWPELQDLLCPRSPPPHTGFDYYPNTDLGPTLFHLARQELGVNIGSKAKTAPNFYNGRFSKTVFVQMPDSNAVLVYVPVWKCGNNQMKSFLKETFKAIPEPSHKAKVACVVTVVRDPVSHFLSGYNEIEYRWKTENRSETMEKQTVLPYLSEELGSEKRFITFVENLLDPTQNRLMKASVFHHVSSMARVLTNVKLSAYLPTLTNMTYTVPQFLHENCIDFPDNLVDVPMPPRGVHPSSKDPLGSYEASKAVWAAQGPVARALCILHALDYACWRDLPDGVPKLCQEVYASEEFVNALF